MSWNELEKQVQVLGTRFTNSAEDCKAAASELDLPGLPPSYVEYVYRFGAGEWWPRLLIAVPRHPKRPVSLGYHAKGWQKALMPAPPSPKVKRLIPFGNHADGYKLCWDTDSLMSSGEMSICLLEHEQEQIIYCGNTLLEFLSEYWIGRRLDKVYPLTGGSWDCEPVFRAIGPGLLVQPRQWLGTAGTSRGGIDLTKRSPVERARRLDAVRRRSWPPRPSAVVTDGSRRRGALAGALRPSGPRRWFRRWVRAGSWLWGRLCGGAGRSRWSRPETAAILAPDVILSRDSFTSSWRWPGVQGRYHAGDVRHGQRRDHGSEDRFRGSVGRLVARPGR
jgi:hypothetical protein